MVEVNTNINIKIKGTNVQLNQKTLTGTKVSDDSIFLKKYDVNNDGQIDEKEALAMLKDLQKAAGNDKLSQREFKKAGFGDKNDLVQLGNDMLYKGAVVVIPKFDIE